MAKKYSRFLLLVLFFAISAQPAYGLNWGSIVPSIKNFLTPYITSLLPQTTKFASEHKTGVALGVGGILALITAKYVYGRYVGGKKIEHKKAENQDQQELIYVKPTDDDITKLKNYDSILTFSKNEETIEVAIQYLIATDFENDFNKAVVHLAFKNNSFSTTISIVNKIYLPNSNEQDITKTKKVQAIMRAYKNELQAAINERQDKGKGTFACRETREFLSKLGINFNQK